MRAHFRDHVQNTVGDAIAGAVVYVYDQGTTNLIAETIYSQDDTVGNATYSNPLTAGNDGLIDFYLNDEKRVDLRITGNNYTTTTRTVDVMKATIPASASLTLRKNSGADVGTRPRINLIEGTAISATVADDAANSEVDVTLGVTQASLDHGSIGGLGDDDHAQYHNDARGDARYWQLATDLATQAELNTHKTSTDHDGRYYTEAEVDALLAAQTLVVRKTADESVTSSTTLQDDNELLFAIGANEEWTFEFRVLAESMDSTLDIDYTVAAPVGCAGWFAEASAFGATLNQNLGAAGQVSVMVIRGVAVNGATPGSIKFRWAQDVSDADAVWVRANSVVIAHKVAA